LVNSLAVKVTLALGQVGQGDLAKHVLDGVLNQLPDLLLGAGIRKYTRLPSPLALSDPGAQ